MKITIIGAGLSGVYAGYLLSKIGHEIIILEAQNRIGGRIYTEFLDNAAIDLGAQWIGPPQHRIMGLVKELRLSICLQHDTGNHILNLNGQITSYFGNICDYNNDINNFFREIDKQSIKNIKNDNLDKISIKEWLLSNKFNKFLSDLIELTIDIDLGWNIENIPFYFWLYFIKNCGGYEKITSKSGGAQEYKIRGGSIELVSSLAKNLDIRLNEIVSTITQEKNKCIIKTQNNIYESDLAIVSIPPQFNANIRYSPVLPDHKYKLYSNLRMSKVRKCVIIYEEPFWRELGFSGEILSNTWPIQLSLDYSSDEFFALVCFICDKWIDTQPTQKDILMALSKYFSDQRALSPKKFIEKDWSQDPWSHGCYFTIPHMNIISKHHQDFQSNYGNIFWIGTETANSWMGYMEGALESAERVIEQIDSLGME